MFRVEVRPEDPVALLHERVAGKTGVASTRQQLFRDAGFKEALLNATRPGERPAKNTLVKTLALDHGSIIYLQNELPSSWGPADAAVRTSGGGDALIDGEQHSNAADSKTSQEERGPSGQHQQKQRQRRIVRKNGDVENLGAQEALDRKAERNELEQQLRSRAESVRVSRRRRREQTQRVSFAEHMRRLKFGCDCAPGAAAVCLQCVPPAEVSYAPKQNCPAGSHKPWPAGSCLSCLPPAAILAPQQPYSHVTYVEVAAYDEFVSFVTHWSSDLHMQRQRVAKLYGTVHRDPVVRGGQKVAIQAMYEPPQEGSESGFRFLRDPGT
jgi:hypothetical protein